MKLTSAWARWDFAICLALVGLTTAVFWPVRHHEFITYDDPNYVTQNFRVQAGLTWSNVAWAFRTTSESNWHPLTWLSHMLDCQWFLLNPGAHHLVNVLFHVANCVLLFSVFKRMTGARWPSAFLAALFAVHPLHVESVAWVSERKDVLSTFFWMLTMWAYVRYVERPALWRYSLALLFFVLGLMSKPMLVTLPFVLLLLDFWPLGRLFPSAPPPSRPRPRIAQRKGIENEDEGNSELGTRGMPFLRLLWEKIPFLMLTAGSCIATYLAQQQGEALISVGAVPTVQRLANASISYARYLGKMIWPSHLSVFYPYVRSWPSGQVLSAVLLLAGLTLLAFWGRRNHRYLAVGWLWYVGTLVPVIGLVQVGAQSIADRYTYVPLIGVFVMIAWGAAALCERWRQKNLMPALLAGAAISICAALTNSQVRFWQNSITLFEHALAVTSESATIHFNLAFALLAKGRPNEALPHLRAGLKRDPRNYWVHASIGDILAGQGKLDEAVANYRESLRLQPDFAEAHSSLALALTLQGKNREAVQEFRETLRLNPDSINALNNLAWILATEEDAAIRNGTEAVRHAERARELTGGREAVYIGTLAAAYAEAGRFPEAVNTAQKAVEMATAAGQKDVARSDQILLELYRAGKAYREPRK